MGNSGSTSSVSNEEKQESTPEETVSGVFLSDELQNRILQDFQSKVLKEEWEKHQKYMIAKGNERRLEEFQKMEVIEQQLNSFHPQNELVQSQLDQRIDELQAKFSDISTAAKFDADRMEKKLTSKKFQASESPCLMARTNVSMCLPEKQGSNDCSDFIRALEKCVQDTIVTKQ